MKIHKTYILLMVIISTVFFTTMFLKGKTYPITGDGKEYILMTQGFINHGSPDLRSEDLHSVIADFKKVQPNFSDPYLDCKKEANCFDNPMVNYVYFTSVKNTLYSWHFPAYSLVNVPMHYLFSKLDYWPTLSFVATNALFFAIALFFVIFILKESFIYKILIIVPMLTGTTYAYLLWNHPESFTFSLSIISLVLLKNNSYKTSAIIMALAALQNQPLGIVAGLFFLYGLVTNIGLSRKELGLFITNKRKVSSTILCGLIIFFIILLPSLFYYYYFNVPNLIVEHKFVDRALVSPHRLYEIFFDLNQGMILFIPFQMLTLIIVFVSHFFYHKNKIHKLPIFLIFLSVIAAIPCLSTINWNPGGQNILRYSYWLSVPIIFSFAEVYSTLKIKKWLLLLLFITVSAALTFLSANNFVFSRDCLEHSPVAKFIMGGYPLFYNPDPEIFIERSLSKENYGSFFNSNKSLAFIHQGFIKKQLLSQRDGKHFGCKSSSVRFPPFVYYNYHSGCKLIDQDISGVITLPLMSVHTGSVINFDSEIFNTSLGWSKPEASYRWSDGNSSHLIFNIDSDQNTSTLKSVTITGTSYGKIIAAIKINDVTIFDGVIAINNEDKQFNVPAGTFRQGVNSITFIWKNPTPPSQGDYRRISFALEKITF
ncbi:hypothetical protein [Sodalis sp. C49]|uniref:hypothetical protein n=1 Tax=Sodalis sp. C49 TaxID=3228929 RepID=UPI003965BCD4